MSAAVWSFLGSVIVGLMSLAGVIYTARRQAKAMDTKLEVSMAEMRKDIQSLKTATEKHNQLIERTYALESRADLLEEKMKVANHRIEDLEEANKS